MKTLALISLAYLIGVGTPALFRADIVDGLGHPCRALEVPRGTSEGEGGQ